MMDVTSHKSEARKGFRAGLLGLMLAVLALAGGCASMVVGDLTNDLSMAILNQDDPETVRAGAPAYLLLIDGLIEGEPDNEDMLLAGAKLYAAYTAVFVEEPKRSKQMSSKAYDYARRALCTEYPRECGLEKLPFAEFETEVAKFRDEDDLPYLFTQATTWLLRIQKHSNDWGAVADLPKVKAMLERVVAVQDNFQDGQAHFYLGILETLLPPALGGKPEVGREYFERAISLSGGKDLSVKVAYANRYARLMFDKELHDRLLREVIVANPNVPGLTLVNTMAQREAEQLLATSKDYFLE